MARSTVIAVDTNILVYAHRADSPFHDRARSVLESLAARAREWAAPWPCAHEFFTVVTNLRIYQTPTPAETAFAQLRALRDCVDYPVVLPQRDIGGRQLLERLLARRSVKLRPAVESNSFEFLRGYRYHEQAVSFQIAIGAVTDGGQIAVREIEDRGFPRGMLLLAHLRDRQLPVVAHALAQQAMQGLQAK